MSPHGQGMPEERAALLVLPFHSWFNRVQSERRNHIGRCRLRVCVADHPPGSADSSVSTRWAYSVSRDVQQEGRNEPGPSRPSNALPLDRRHLPPFLESLPAVVLRGVATPRATFLVGRAIPAIRYAVTIRIVCRSTSRAAAAVGDSAGRPDVVAVGRAGVAVVAGVDCACLAVVAVGSRRADDRVAATTTADSASARGIIGDGRILARAVHAVVDRALV